MGTGHPPRNKQNRRGPGKVASPEHRDDGPFDVLSPLLEEAAAFPDDESPRHELLSLLEENARLRALAVKLSNLLGDLPVREWEEAARPQS